MGTQRRGAADDRRSSKLHLFGATIVLVAVATASADDADGIVLGPPKELPGTDRHVAVAVADIDGDGRNDIVLAGWNDAELLVHPGNGNGTFAPAVTFPLPVAQVASIVVGRLDGDLRDDLVLSETGTATIAVRLGAGGAAVASAAPDGVAGETESPALVDWDGDGDLDILTASTLRMRVRLNDGAGHFGTAQPAALPGAPTGTAIAAGDVDGDGLADLVIAAPFNSLVFWGEPGGGFSAGPPITASGFESMSIADVDGDGRADIVGHALSGLRRLIVVVRHTSARTFGNGVSYSVEGGSRIVENHSEPGRYPGLAVADFNGDGAPDILTGGGLRMNAGDGTFGRVDNDGYVWIPNGVDGGIAAGDLDGDGTPDVVKAFGGNYSYVNSAAIYFVRPADRGVAAESSAPATLYPGGVRIVRIAGSGFTQTNVVRLDGGVNVDNFLVESDTSLVLQVATAPGAALGPRALDVFRADGARTTLEDAFTVAPGGVATVESVSAPTIHAGEASVVDVTGSGFLPGVQVYPYEGVTHISTELVDDTHLKITLELERQAPVGVRDLEILNGSGIVTNAPSAITIVPPRPIDLAVVKGRLRPAARGPFATFTASGTFAFNEFSADGVFDPATESAELRFGDPKSPVVIEIPNGAGWRTRRGRLTWHSPKRPGPRVVLTLDLARGTFSVTATHVAFDPAPAADVVVGFALGDDDARSVTTWTASRNGALTLRRPSPRR